MTVDLIVLGSGEAAQSVAYPCREAGWSVTVVDSDPYRGTCSLRGCDPKKVLVGVSELVDWARRMQGNGITSPPPKLDWPDMIRFKHTFVDDVPASNENSFSEAGIRAIQKRAHCDSHRSQCSRPKGDGVHLSHKHARHPLHDLTLPAASRQRSLLKPQSPGRVWHLRHSGPQYLLFQAAAAIGWLRLVGDGLPKARGDSNRAG
jgi:hypothetical protein